MLKKYKIKTNLSNQYNNNQLIILPQQEVC